MNLDIAFKSSLCVLLIIQESVSFNLLWEDVITEIQNFYLPLLFSNGSFITDTVSSEGDDGRAEKVSKCINHSISDAVDLRAVSQR